MKSYINNNTGILIRIDDVCENMDWELMKHLPEITQNRLGAAVVIDSEGTFLSNNSQFGNIHDTGFIQRLGSTCYMLVIDSS